MSRDVPWLPLAETVLNEGNALQMINACGDDFELSPSSQIAIWAENVAMATCRPGRK
jgi:hypothetical protein